jgi:hypothetical protein
MLSHRVSEYFGDIIEVERHNVATPFDSTHYGDLPWSKTDPKFASRTEKYLVYKDGRSAKRTEPSPAYCESSQFKRFFRITKFKAVTTPPTDKPERRRKEST